MPTEQQVYEQFAEQYERLIEREDHQNNIIDAIQNICPPKGLDVVDLGAGTGRLTRILAPLAGSIRAYDTSAHMLEKAQSILRGKGLTNWQAGVADHRQIPAPDASADLVVSGWSFCYLAVWGGDNWRTHLEQGYQEIRRILRPGGTIIIFETLGTGHESPNPPQSLANYFDWLGEKGFQSEWIRTDYSFNSLHEAAELSSFFFGEQMSKEVIAKDWVVLPECTGVWWQKGE